MQVKVISRLAMVLVVIIILDYLSRVISVFRTPNGGVLSFVPTGFVIAAIIAKLFYGFIFGAITSVLTFFIGSQWFVNIFQFLFDYPLALGIAIMLGSLSWRIMKKLKWPFLLRSLILPWIIILWQWISYTIAFLFYVGTKQMYVQGLSTNFWNNFIILWKASGIYMVPILLGNVIVAPIIANTFKKYLS